MFARLTMIFAFTFALCGLTSSAAFAQQTCEQYCAKRCGMAVGSQKINCNSQCMPACALRAQQTKGSKKK
jgi:hypothetical protein